MSFLSNNLRIGVSLDIFVLFVVFVDKLLFLGSTKG
jgi:hypothetical protein